VRDDQAPLHEQAPAGAYDRLLGPGVALGVLGAFVAIVCITTVAGLLTATQGYGEISDDDLSAL
jgi:hypothetical protein